MARHRTAYTLRTQCLDSYLRRGLRHRSRLSDRTFSHRMDSGHFAIGSVLAAEAFNSAIEALADRVNESYDEAIKRTKDLASGAVLLLAIAAAVVGLIIFVPKLFPVSL